MTTIIKIRRDTAANWTSANPILASGEPGLETDTLALKYGDGVTEWNDLEYSAVGNAAYANVAGTANVANIAYSVNVSNVANIGNIATINLDGNASNALRGDGSFGPVDSAGTSISNGLSEVAIESANGNVLININDGSSEWQFQDNNNLIFPGGALVDTSDSNFEFRQFENFNVEANSDINLYTGGGNYQWTFTDTGNLTLPANTFSVNYANGSAVQLGGGGSGSTLGFDYTKGNANIAGQFSTSANIAANVTSIVINPVASGNINLEALIDYFEDKKVIATISDTSNNQASYDVGTFTPSYSSYNGWRAVYSKLWDNDPAFCKIGFYQDTANFSVTTQSNTDDDEFRLNLDDGFTDILGLIIIYTENDNFVPSKANLQEYFENFVDNVLTPASGNITDIRTNFYASIKDTTALITAWGEKPYNLEFYNGYESLYENVSATSNTSVAGSGFTANVALAGDTTYIVVSFEGGTLYEIGDTLTFDGTSFNGVTVTNDMVLTVTQVSSGAITEFTTAGVNSAVWPTENIDDGGDDQYDTGNFLKTNQQSPVPYSNGNVETSGAFSSQPWFVGYAYGQFVFIGDNQGTVVNEFGTYGETGSDGNGFRKTGVLNDPIYYTTSFSSVLDSTNAFDVSSGSFKLTFDVTGPNTQGVVFQNQRTITTLTSDLYIKAADDVRIQSSDYVEISAGNKFPYTQSTGGGIGINGGQGSDGRNVNSVNAGGGGDITIQAGSAGSDDGNSALGGQGGTLSLIGGSSSGNNIGGEVSIRGGYGSVYGNVSIGVNNNNWVFDNSGNLTLPNNTFSINYANGTQVPLGGATSQLANGNVTLTLETNGDIVFPSSAKVVNGGNNLNFQPGANGATQIYSADGNIYWSFQNYNAFEVPDNSNIWSYSNLGIAVDSHRWTFENDGNLTLPGGMKIIGETNILGSNVAAVIAYDNLPLLSLSTGNAGSASSIWIENGDDIANSNIAAVYASTPGAVGNVRIVSGTNGANVYVWDFDNTGNLSIPSRIVGVNAPDNNGYLQWIGNSSGDGSGYTTLNLVPDDTLTSGDQYVILDPTGPGHIHIRAGGTQDGSNASLYLGGENSYFMVPAGSNTSVYVNADGNSWTFGNDGNLSAPGGISAAGNVVSNGYARFSGSFDESEASTAGLYLGYAGNTSRIMFGTGNTSQTFEIDNDGGNLRFYQPGNTKATLTSTGDLSILGNITANNLGNIVVWTTAPVANTSAGTAGQAAYDTGGNLYVCVTTNTWAKFTGTTSW